MSWNEFFQNEKEKPYFNDLISFVKEEYKNHICYPLYDDIFNAFKFTPYEDIKVVIIGQDPYFNEGEAHGLSFSVKCSKLPPSLKNIYKEMSSDLNYDVNQDGDLTYLAQQGVFLLNTTLSVRKASPLSHYKKGWEELTSNTIKYIEENDNPIVYILWGNNAQKLEKYISNKNHMIIKSSHPSPLGAYRGFFGSKPFSKTNEFLKSSNIKEIKWYK